MHKFKLLFKRDIKLFILYLLISLEEDAVAAFLYQSSALRQFVLPPLLDKYAAKSNIAGT